MNSLHRRLVTAARPARRYLVTCVALGAATAGLVVAQADLIALTVSRAFLDGADLVALTGPLLSLSTVFAVRAGLAWAQESAAHAAAAGTVRDLRGRLLRAGLAHGPGWLSGRRTGELAVLATRGIDALDAYFARYLPQLVLAVVVPLVVGVRILAADWLSALIVAVTLPLIPLFMVLIGLATRKVAQRRWRAIEVLSGHFLDLVAGLGVLRSFGRAAAQAQVIADSSERYRRHTMATLRVALLSALVLELAATLSVALVAVSIGLRLLHGGLDLRTALVVLLLAPEAYLPLRRVGEHYHAAADGVAAATRVFQIVDEPAAPVGRAAAADPARCPVRLHAVTVRYPDRDRDAVADLSLTLRPGTVTGLSGPSGCGKSTVLALLLGSVRPTGGRITVGGLDLAEVDPDDWRRRLTWVPQRPRLLARTVADNLRIGRPGADTAALRAAAEAAALDIDLDTSVGEQGSLLSAGQRRRVAVARALLRDAGLVLLDEPTEDLDPDTEAALVARVATRLRGRTVLLVAHRAALLDLCDQVVELRHSEAVAA